MCTHARQMAGFFAEAQVRYDKIMGCAKFGAVRQPRYASASAGRDKNRTPSYICQRVPPKPELTVALGFIYTSPYRTQDCSYTGEYTYPRPRSKALGLGAREVFADRERPRGNAYGPLLIPNPGF